MHDKLLKFCGLLHSQVSVPEAIAASLMVVLPGVDANDPSKCLTVFRLYCLALLSLPTLPVLPLNHALLSACSWTVLALSGAALLRCARCLSDQECNVGELTLLHYCILFIGILDSPWLHSVRVPELAKVIWRSSALLLLLRVSRSPV